MMSDGGKNGVGGGGGVLRHGGKGNGFIPSSFRALSSYLRIVSSGASTVARSAVSAASAIVERDEHASHDQVNWAGFDKLEGEGNVCRKVLLLGYHSGFQVWDVEEADNVRDLVSTHDGPISFMQMLPKPIASKRSDGKFAESRPLLVVCADGSVDTNIEDGSAPRNGVNTNSSFVPTVVRIYSLRTQSYVHVLKFRSAVYSVKCSSRVVAVSQSTQIHCFDATSLEREYTLLTNPVPTGFPGSGGGISCGPVAVGNRWLAYSGNPVAVTNFGRVNPQHLAPSVSFPSNGSLVAHYAKESSKQLAVGIATLGDMGYKKLSRYYSELVPDSITYPQSGNPGLKANRTVNGHSTDTDSVGMVIVRDIVSKAVIAQFRAHQSPISALCFDPSGTLLVSASVQGHNINVFKIMPGPPGVSSSTDVASHVHLYTLQRGMTNAIIQDISFSDDSNWIMVSSSRGTSHLFAINPCGGHADSQSSDVTTKAAVRWPPSSGSQMPHQQSMCSSGPPVTLSVVSRIRNGNNSWRGTVTGAAAAATGKMTSFSGAIASSFHNAKGNNYHGNSGSLKGKYHLLVFSPSGCMIQYALRIPNVLDLTVVTGSNTACESDHESDGRLVVEAIQKWNVCQKQTRREREDNTDIYGDNRNLDNNKIYPEGLKKGINKYPEAWSSIKNEKMTADEKHHLYISEAEMQMHETQTPLWTRPELYFQSMIVEGVKRDGETVAGGEIEIERIPTRMVEARSKDLVPVFDYHKNPVFQPTRVAAVNSNISGRLLKQRSGISENDRVSCRSSSNSLDSMTQIGAGLFEHCNGTEETGLGVPQMTIANKGSVNSDDCPEIKTQPETVNSSREHSYNMEAQLKHVNNDIEEDMGMGNLFEQGSDEYD